MFLRLRQGFVYLSPSSFSQFLKQRALGDGKAMTDLKRVLYKRLLRQGLFFLGQKSPKERSIGLYLFQSTRAEFRKHMHEKDSARSQLLFERGVRTLAIVNNAALDMNANRQLLRQTTTQEQEEGGEEEEALQEKQEEPSLDHFSEFDLLYQASSLWYKNAHRKRGRYWEQIWTPQLHKLIDNVNAELNIALTHD